MKRLDPVDRVNYQAVLLVVVAVMALPLSLVGFPSVPFLGLKADPMSGAWVERTEKAPGQFAVRTHEPFAMELALMAATAKGDFTALRLNPENWRKVESQGVQARIFSRAMTEAPVLPVGHYETILPRILSGKSGQLQRDLGLPKDLGDMTLSIKSLTPGSDSTWLLEIP